MDMPLKLATKPDLFEVPCIRETDHFERKTRMRSIHDVNAGGLSGLNVGLFPDRDVIKVPFVTFQFIEQPGVVEKPHRTENADAFRDAVRIDADERISKTEPGLVLLTEEVEIEFRSSEDSWTLPSRRLTATVETPCGRYADIDVEGNLIRVDWDRDTAVYGVQIR